MCQVDVDMNEEAPADPPGAAQRGQDATVRDSFAARAPSVIPDWFRHKSPREVPTSLTLDQALRMDRDWSGLANTMQCALQEWMRDPVYDIDSSPLLEIGKAAFERITQRDEERERAIEANRAARYFAWRWYYADEMVKGREALPDRQS